MSSHLLPIQRTKFIKDEEIKKEWYLIDAKDQILGRLAAFIAYRLQGKHKATFSPHQNVGDFIVVINAEKVKVSGNKFTEKKYYHHSGYPGGLKIASFKEKLKKDPTFIIEKAVKRMLPDGRRGRAILKQLKIYAGEVHPHIAQKPKPLTINFKKFI